jgi:hypothetical protein
VAAIKGAVLESLFVSMAYLDTAAADLAGRARKDGSKASVITAATVNASVIATVDNARYATDWALFGMEHKAVADADKIELAQFALRGIGDVLAGLPDVVSGLTRLAEKEGYSLGRLATETSALRDALDKLAGYLPKLPDLPGGGGIGLVLVVGLALGALALGLSRRK